MTTRKTRFFVDIGFKAEILSVIEKRNGELILCVKPNRYYERGDVDFSPMKEHRYTVHLSLESTGHLLTGTIGLKDGSVRRQSAYVECAGRPFIWHLLSRRPSEMPADTYKMPEHPRDNFLAVQEFDERYNNLLYHVIVSDQGALNVINFGGRPVTIAEFRLFDVAIITGFVNFRAIQRGDTASDVTTAVEVDGEILEDFERTAGVTLSPGEIGPSIDRHNTQLLRRLRERGRDDIKSDDPRRAEFIAIFEALVETVSPTPFTEYPSFTFWG